MNVGSLFSGIGGLELGFEAQGFTIAWYVEKDDYAARVIRKHNPTALIYGDITQLDFTTVPKVDILTGGFPAQHTELDASETQLFPKSPRSSQKQSRRLSNEY